MIYGSFSYILFFFRILTRHFIKSFVNECFFTLILPFVVISILLRINLVESWNLKDFSVKNLLSRVNVMSISPLIECFYFVGIERPSNLSVGDSSRAVHS
jgi:hypothetical protein